MPAGTMVDRILAAPRRPALKAMQLGNEPLVVEKLDAPAVEQRKRVTVDVRLDPL
jgi:hypothetical protein